MHSLVSAIVSAVANTLLVVFGVFAWWLGLIVFFVGWIVIWALSRMTIAGDSIGDLGEAAFDFGDSSGGGWGGDGGGSSCDSGSGGGGD